MTTRPTTTDEEHLERCVHYWLVEPAGGPTSGAQCRNCGEERSFYNNPDAVTDMYTIEHRRSQGSAWKRAPHHRD